MGIAKKLGLDRSGTPKEPEKVLPSRPSSADYVYVVALGDEWRHHLSYSCGVIENEVYRTKEAAESRCGNGDVILTCQVLQVDRRKTVFYTESVKRNDEP